MSTRFQRASAVFDKRARSHYDPAMHTTLSPLQQRVARDIVSLARRENLKAGDRLTTSHLASAIGTSRSPILAALAYLEHTGVVTRDPNRGYSLARDALSLDALVKELAAQPDDPLYLRIAEDRLGGQLPELVNEIDLMRRYEVSRSTLRSVLARIQKEDWIEKLVGFGWKFLPMIDSEAAYRESYVFRSSIETAGLLSEGFCADADELAALRQQQQFIAETGFASMTPIELFETNARFHETLAKWSNNRFILYGVKRTNQLRRLVEYRQATLDRVQRQRQILGHLAILDAISAGDLAFAAELLHAHLNKARREKTWA